MANQLFSTPGILTQFITPGNVRREDSVLPLGQLSHTDQTAIAASVSGDVLVISLPLPIGNAYRLRHLMVSTTANSTVNVWDDPLFRIYWAPGELQNVNTVQQLEYPMGVTFPNDNLERWYGLGFKGNSNADAAFPQSMQPEQWLTSVPAGVGAWEPSIRIASNSPTGVAGTLTYCVLWDVINIEQRNHVGVNTVFPVL